MVAYRILRRIFAFIARVFFRQIEVVGLENVPQSGDGPVIFAGNHPNSLLDPVLILTTCGRIVHFAAKDVLFQGRILRAVLLGIGAVPIARRMDHKDGALDNQTAFDSLARVLVEGRAMGIFPEGISHDSSQLARLKTGVARIALTVAKKQADGDARSRRVRIVPCGLTYVRRKRFRSRVLVQYGAPIDVTDEMLAAVGDEARERAAARELTDIVERGLRALTVNAPDWETLGVLDAVRRLYQPPQVALEQRVELARRFAAVYATVKEKPEVQALYRRVADYLARLRALGLSDRDLRRKMSAGEHLWRVGRQLLLGLLWLPLALPGLILHGPFGLLIGQLGLLLTPRKDVIATTKLILGLLVVPLVHAGALGLLWWRYGFFAALIGIVVLTISAYATLRVLERGARFGQLVAATVRVLRLGREVAALQAERAALEVAVALAVERFRPADMVPLFPRAAPGAAE